MRKSWHDAKSQKGAFNSLDSAKRCAKLNPGYSVYDTSGKVVYPISNFSSKSIDILAREVIKGEWGDGQDRKNRLQRAGYDYNAVQRRVNEIL